MSSYFTLTLDTTGPAGVTVSIASGATYATAVLQDLTIGCADSDKTGYQMKIWGDIDLAWAKTNGIVGGSATTVLEADGLWITYATTKQIQLTTGDGTKTIYLKVRDDVYNQSSQASDTITLDTTKPIVTITGPDVPKISEQAGKDVSAFSFSVDQAFTEYKVKVVSAGGATHDTGTQIPVTAGSTNMSGTAGNYPASTPINCTIDGTDLKTASAGDSAKTIKVFVKDSAGNWSV